MNAIELLKTDHQEAMDLMDQLEEIIGDFEEETEEGMTAMSNEPVQLFSQLKNALTLHTQLEEAIFYPAMKQFDETRDMISEALEEHQEVDQILNDMSTMSPGDEDFQDKLEELRDSVEHHVDEEENELFPKAEELCGEKQLNQMGQQMLQMKQGKSAKATNRQI